MQRRLIFTMILMVIVVIFSLANSAPVKFTYFIGKKIEISLALIIIISALIGAIAAAVTGLGRQFKLSREIGEKENQLKDLNRRLTELTGEATNNHSGSD